MAVTTQLHVLKVFVGADGAGGNPLGVFLDGAGIPPQRRQEVAADLGFSETVFVDDVRNGTLQIFTPAAELDFAGHPLVGTGWLLAREDGATTLRPPAGDVPCWQEHDESWIRGRAAWTPQITFRRLDTPADVEAFDPAAVDVDFLYVWAWAQEPGRVWSRSFPRALGIREDEATGAAAVRLTHELGEALTITQGVGSLLRTRPGDDGTVEVGGAVVAVEVRGYR